jgi:6-pyruvoyltetrahydropterin/6-carboxytetrahydropterin synthase
MADTFFNHVRVQTHIRKEALKFAAAHMTVFADGTKEHLHGHNYSTELTVQLRAGAPTLAAMVPFSAFKTVLKTLCDTWDERVLLAERCPFFKLNSKADDELDFTLCGKHYVLPTDEVVLLPLETITTETLATELCRRLIAGLDAKVLAAVDGLELRVDEITGQGASCAWTTGART